MNKSLAPLIISFAVIILLTFIIINSKPSGGALELQTNGTAPSMTLSQGYRKSHGEPSAVQKGKRAYVPEAEKSLEDARKSLAAGKEADAEEALRTLLVFDPDNLEALSLLGGIFYYSQRYAEAEMIFRRQIRLSPENDSVYNHLGSALAKQSKIQDGISATLKAIEINPKSSDSQINIASMYASAGNTESCMKHLVTAYQLIGYSILPLTYDQSFDKVRSSPEFQELIARAKKDADTRLNFDRIPKAGPGQKNGIQQKPVK